MKQGSNTETEVKLGLVNASKQPFKVCFENSFYVSQTYLKNKNFILIAR